MHRGLATTGVVGTLKGKRKGQKTIGLRADMDALHLQEKNDFAHVSVHDHRMHACGHDGHTAMLLGAARHLAANPDFAGTVHFIFQPAEEGLGGARVMIEEGLFDRFNCDVVYGMHNMPGIDTGTFAIRAGAMLASSDSWEVTFKGTGGHGAMPDRGTDPTYVAAQFIVAVQGIVGRNVPPSQAAVLSVGHIHGGTPGSPNVIPSEVLIKGTARSFSADVRALLRTLRLPLPERLSRRTRTTRRGARIDMRRTVRAQLRGDSLRLAYREARHVRPPLVILADVSGSMERYTRMLIFFAHAVAQCEARVETFAFGTRLARITPELAGDPDRALARLAARAGDWGGGTRIAQCLARFNRAWARRVLGPGASVLLITDGLDVAPDDAHAAALAAEAARLKRSARHVLWLNPLLRYAGFEARAHSIRALLPHCSAFLPAHNLESLRQLGAVFSSLSHRSGSAALAMQARARLRAPSIPAH